MLRSMLHRFDARVAFLERIRQSDHVLDVGCGRGGTCRAILALQPRVTLCGVDRERLPELPQTVQFTKVDLDQERLPYADASFDVIVFTHVIEHLHRPLDLAPELCRVLRRGGLMYTEAPNWVSAAIPSFGFHRDQHGAFNFYDDPTHVHPWSKQGLYEFTTCSCGLETLKVGTVRNWFRIPLDIPRCAAGLHKARRDRVISAAANAVGWSIYAIGRKP